MTAMPTAPLISRPPLPLVAGPQAVKGFDIGGASFVPSADVLAKAVSIGLDAVLVAVDQRGDIVSALPVEFRQRATMAGTATLVGTDASGVLRIVATTTANPPSFKLNVRYREGLPALPRELLPAFRFLRALRRPARLEMMVGDQLLGGSDELPDSLEFPAELVEIARALAFVQATIGAEFPMPAKFSGEDLRALREAEALLSGETVSSRWSQATLTLSPIDEDLLGLLDGDSQFMFEFVGPAIPRIGGHDLPLGQAQYTFRAARIDNYDELVEAAQSSEVSSANAALSRGDDDQYDVALITPPFIGLDLQAMRPPVVASRDALESARRNPLQRDAFETADP